MKADEYRNWISRGYHGVKPGWCRVGFHYVFDEPEVQYLIDCIEFVAEYGHLFVHQYRFDARGGGWEHRFWEEEPIEFSLQAALRHSQPMVPGKISDGQRKTLYREYLEQALHQAHELTVMDEVGSK